MAEPRKCVCDHLRTGHSWNGCLTDGCDCKISYMEMSIPPAKKGRGKPKPTT